MRGKRHGPTHCPDKRRRMLIHTVPVPSKCNGLPTILFVGEWDIKIWVCVCVSNSNVTRIVCVVTYSYHQRNNSKQFPLCGHFRIH